MTFFRMLIAALATSILFSSASHAAEQPKIDPASLIPLHHGFNRIDFDGDAIEDVVLKSHFGRNNPHNANAYYFLRHYTKQDSEDIRGNFSSNIEWGQILFENDEGHYEHEITTHHGADFTLRDLRLLKDKTGTTAIIANRSASQGYIEAEKIHFNIYNLIINAPPPLPGTPTIYFKQTNRFTTSLCYYDVGTAFLNELGLARALDEDDGDGFGPVTCTKSDQ